MAEPFAETSFIIQHENGQPVTDITDVSCDVPNTPAVRFSHINHGHNAHETMVEVPVNRNKGISPGTPSIPTGNSHRDSRAIDRTIDSTVGSGQRVEGAFQGIVKEMRNLAAKKPTIARFLKYAFLVTVIGVVLYIIDYYVTIPHVKLVIPVLVLIFVPGPLLFYLFYRQWGTGAWAINWRLRKAARYLDVCEISKEYTERLLPDLGPETERICHCRLAGSSGDGFGFFPTLSANVGICHYHKEPPLVQDVDMNIFYNNLHIKEDNLYKYAQTPGFRWICFDEQSNRNPFINDCLVQHLDIPGMLFLSGKLISDKIRRNLPDEVEYSYPALTLTKFLRGPQGQYKFDIDVVFGIKLSTWPAEASEWITRENRTIQKEVVDEIIEKGCYVVHKHCNVLEHSCFIAHQGHDLDWRITFAEAETKLFHFHSEKHALKLVYVILKFAFKFESKQKKIKYPALKSYHLKTIFLWIAEEISDFDLVNIKKNKNLKGLFYHVLLRYKSALTKKSLPHYFMPSINILEQYTDKEVKQGLDVIKAFERKPLFIIDMFDKAWLNKRNLDILLIVLVILLGFSFFMKFFYEHRERTLLAESRQLLLEGLGMENSDILHLTDDPDQLRKFYECVTYKFLIISALKRGNYTLNEFDIGMNGTSITSNTTAPTQGALNLLELFSPWKIAVLLCRYQFGFGLPSLGSV